MKLFFKANFLFVFNKVLDDIDDLVQDYRFASVLAVQMLQTCFKPLIC